jgi:hypothetical protein
MIRAYSGAVTVMSACCGLTPIVVAGRPSGCQLGLLLKQLTGRVHP